MSWNVRNGKWCFSKHILDSVHGFYTILPHPHSFGFFPKVKTSCCGQHRKGGISFTSLSALIFSSSTIFLWRCNHVNNPAVEVKEPQFISSNCSEFFWKAISWNQTVEDLVNLCTFMFLEVFSEAQWPCPRPTYKVGASDKHQVPGCINKSMDQPRLDIIVGCLMAHEHCTMKGALWTAHCTNTGLSEVRS